MPALSLDEIGYLRTHPHMAKFFLSLYIPKVLFYARVDNAAIARGAREIKFGTVTTPPGSGGWAAVTSGVTLYVGYELGFGDKGRVRVKSCTADTLTVAENDHIEWLNNDWLCVVDYHEPWGVFPRIELDNPDPDLATTVNIWKDYDIPYVDQNSSYPPVAMMGPPAVGFLHDGVCSFYFDGAESYGLNGASIASWTWSFPNGTPASYSGVTPGFVQWTSAGFRTAKLTVVDSKGKEHTGYRPVIIYDGPNPEDGVFPYGEFEVSSLQGDYGSGSWTCGLIVRDRWGRLTHDYFRDNGLVIVWAEGMAGDGQLPISPSHPRRRNLLFVGYVDAETARRDPETNDVTFNADGICARMSKIDMFSNTLEVPGVLPDSEVATPPWLVAENLNLDLAIYAHLKWQSTIFDIADVYLTGTGATKAIMRQDFQASDIYSQCNQLMGAVLGRMLSDKAGSIYCRIDPLILPTADRLGIASWFTMLDKDWKGEQTITRRILDEVSQLDLGGVLYDGGTDPELDAHPILSLAPGSCPRYEGRIEKMTGLILEGQEQANQLSGDVLAQRNNPYPSIRQTMSGMYTFLDFAPPEWIIWSLATTATKRGIGWIYHRFVPRSVQISIERAGGYADVTLDMEKETDGSDGINGNYPPTAEPETPEPYTPETPPVVTPPSPPGASGWRKHVLVGTNLGPYYTENFVSDSDDISGVPTWQNLIGGMGGDIDVQSLAFHPTNPELTHYCCTPNAIYRREPTVSGDWVSMLTAVAAGAAVGDGRDPHFYTIQTNPCAVSDLYAILWTGPLVDLGNPPKIWFCKSTDKGATWSYVMVSNNAFRYSIVSALQVQSVDPGNDLYFAAKDSWAGSGLYVSEDRGATWSYRAGSRDSGSDTQYYQSHVDGRVWKNKNMGAAHNHLYRSDDHGVTWVEEAAHVYNNTPSKHWMNSQMVAAGLTRLYNGSGTMYKSFDYGATWETITADPLTGFPCNIELVPDAVDNLYIMKWAAAIVTGPNVIFASNNDMITCVAKGGANANIPDTGGGDSIPYNATIRDGSPIWTIE